MSDITCLEVIFSRNFRVVETEKNFILVGLVDDFSREILHLAAVVSDAGIAAAEHIEVASGNKLEFTSGGSVK